MKKFENFTISDLKNLRSQICLNSIYVSDYNNSFGLDPNCVCTFFDGFVEFMQELAETDNELKGVDKEITFDDIMEYDTPQTLLEWFYCFDDFSWVKYVEEEF